MIKIRNSIEPDLDNSVKNKASGTVKNTQEESTVSPEPPTGSGFQSILCTHSKKERGPK